MARPRSRATAAVVSVLLLLLFIVGDALLHPYSALPATSATTGNTPPLGLRGSSASSPSYRRRRRRPQDPHLGSHVAASPSSPSPSSSSRVSRLDDAVASAAERMMAASTVMSISSGNLEVSIFPSDSRTTQGGSTRGAKLIIKASHVDTDTGTRRTWTATRSEKDFFALGATIMGQLGATLERRVPSPPPEGSSAAIYQVYLRRLIGLPDATALPALYEFLDTPSELVQEPVLFGEVIDDDFWSVSTTPYRSADPDTPRTASSSSYRRYPTGPPAGANNNSGSKSGATVAGAVLGGLVAGPLGAAVGAVAARAASKREDGVGSVAKGAGAVADVAMEKAQALEREFELSRKAKTAAGNAKQAVQKVDLEYSVRQRAKDAARKTVRAAKRTSRDLRVSERAAGAAKVTEQAARRAAEAARKADEEHRIRERAGDAFRRVRSRVKRSVENMDERRKRNPGDRDPSNDRR
eukprot:g11086.t1